MDIAVPIAKRTGPAKQSGIEGNAIRKMFAVLAAITITDARESGRKRINLQKENEANLALPPFSP